METLTREVAVVKEERDHALLSEKESHQRISLLRQELFSVTEQLRSSISKIQQMERQHRETIDSLKNGHKVILGYRQKNYLVLIY